MEKNKKFLIICSFGKSLINFRKELIIDLIGIGFEIHVAAPDFNNPIILKQLQCIGVTTHDINMKRNGINPFWDILTIFSIIKLLIKIKPKYVFAYTIKPVIYGMIASKLCGVSKRFALITGLGYAFTNEDGGLKKLLRFVARMLYKLSLVHCTKTFFQNKDDLSLFRKLGLINKKNKFCVVNGSGVNLVYFKKTPIDNKDLVFLMIGRLIGDKGVREYIQAARIIKASHPSICFKLAGWVDTNPDSVSIKELNSWIDEGIIDYLGELDDVRKSIESCSVYVLPSYREGIPRSVLEAMSIGRAIITTDAPGCRETVINGYNGFLVDVKSVDELVLAMMKFITHKNLVSLMGYRSREFVENKFDVNIINKYLIVEMGLI